MASLDLSQQLGRLSLTSKGYIDDIDTVAKSLTIDPSTHMVSITRPAMLRFVDEPPSVAERQMARSEDRSVSILGVRP